MHCFIHAALEDLRFYQKLPTIYTLGHADLGVLEIYRSSVGCMRNKIDLITNVIQQNDQISHQSKSKILLL